MSDCNKNKNCGCENGLTTPQPCVNIFNCEEEKCSETFDSKCIIYTGENIMCNVNEVVSQGDTVEAALQKTVEYFCNNQPLNVVVESGDETINVETNTVGNDIIHTITYNQKYIDYKENIETIELSSTATPSVYSFPSPAYSTLSFTNTTGLLKTYKIFCSYESITTPLSVNNSDIANWVDGAIIKTVSSIDTIQYESLGQTFLSGSLYDGPLTNDSVNIGTTNKVLSQDTSAVEFRFRQGQLPKNTSFFYLVSLQDGEAVSLKFKTKDSLADSTLLKAQMMIEEV